MADQGVREYVGALIYMEIEEFEEPLEENDFKKDYMDDLVYTGVNVWLKEGTITLDEITRSLWVGLDDYINGETGVKEPYDLIDYGLDKTLL